jgi:hypothetical protein
MVAVTRSQTKITIQLRELERQTKITRERERERERAREREREESLGAARAAPPHGDVLQWPCGACHEQRCMAWVHGANGKVGYYRQRCPKPSPAQRKDELGDDYATRDDYEDEMGNGRCWVCGSGDLGEVGFDRREEPPEDRYCACCWRRFAGDSYDNDPRPWSEDEQTDEEGTTGRRL